ncbi:PqqD family protein [Paludibacter jiangxiensis]|uniref:Coenzyme PQQ synthesis protein D n=1 Tax=Paludibacter jiangxiensis TaxID=681398 RepID=A0A171A1G2_9BACT|nr:PqqD family protein [Paludibacter jiangxiensis]GAT63211.1 coenzyme PQQ synthesis protein D [Paludibacter jiangxiensis]
MIEKYCKNRQIIDGELDDNQVMMHLENGKYFGLNPVGKRIWALLDQPKSFEEIIGVLMTEFEVEEKICRKEVLEFLDKAVKFEIVQKV